MKTQYLFRISRLRGKERKVTFRTTDIKSALRFLKWYAKKYREGLLLEILPIKKVYHPKTRTISYIYE